MEFQWLAGGWNKGLPQRRKSRFSALIRLRPERVFVARMVNPEQVVRSR
jgi:hypothetical protein